MIRWLWLPVGLAAFHFDRLRYAVRGRGPSGGRRAARTGRVVTHVELPVVTDHGGGVRVIRYRGNPSHSLWRSQELSLFHSVRDRLPEPRLDFGCGDGSFSLVAFGHGACGVDPDCEALHTAVAFDAYDGAVCGDGRALPFANGSFRSAWANSVFEHTEDPRAVVGELSRVLVPGGRLVFTVPTVSFAAHLTRYFGRDESDAVNRSYDHKHLNDLDWWRQTLDEAAFDIELLNEYQPDWFTFAHRTFGTGVIGTLLRSGAGERLWSLVAPRLVAASIAGTVNGANVFVVARRRMDARV